MAKRKSRIVIPDDVVVNKIVLIRGKKVMIDSDLAELYAVPTKRLNEQVRRNSRRFPEDFMFQLTPTEKQLVTDNYEHLNRLKFSASLPFAFTEHGAVMLASVLNSNRAIDVNVQIVRIFTRMREVLISCKDILIRLEKLERKGIKDEEKMGLIFKYLKEFLIKSDEPMRKIGFRLPEMKPAGRIGKVPLSQSRKLPARRKTI